MKLEYCEIWRVRITRSNVQRGVNKRKSGMSIQRSIEDGTFRAKALQMGKTMRSNLESGNYPR
jgi:hypothetical protein